MLFMWKKKANFAFNKFQNTDTNRQCFMFVMFDVM